MKLEIKTENYIWIHINNPSKKAIQELDKKYDFHDLLLEDLISDDSEPNINLYNETLALSINFSKYDIENRKHIININVFNSSDYKLGFIYFK